MHLSDHLCHPLHQYRACTSPGGVSEDNVDHRVYADLHLQDLQLQLPVGDPVSQARRSEPGPAAHTGPEFKQQAQYYNLGDQEVSLEVTVSSVETPRTGLTRCHLSVENRGYRGELKQEMRLGFPAITGFLDIGDRRLHVRMGLSRLRSSGQRGSAISSRVCEPATRRERKTHGPLHPQSTLGDEGTDVVERLLLRSESAIQARRQRKPDRTSLPARVLFVRCCALNSGL
ncbi:hypothetical protein H920_01032 [Fukomys damarensis]|uniref:Uncharacterized protein n=1 Tax=Fukomys damarensis TaxID=885580 RepID=A0A091E2H1_FUKDA|nr:hypothetical protein H920_01032 [Fukomys damarensis]